MFNSIPNAKKYVKNLENYDHADFKERANLHASQIIFKMLYKHINRRLRIMFGKLGATKTNIVLFPIADRMPSDQLYIQQVNKIRNILDELGYDSRYIIKSKLSDSGVIVISLKDTKQPFKLSICRISNYFAVVVLLIYSIIILIASILAHYHSLAYIV